MVSLPGPAVHNVVLTPDDPVLSLQAWDDATNSWAVWNIFASCPGQPPETGGPVVGKAGPGVQFGHGAGGFRALMVQMNAATANSPAVEDLFDIAPDSVLDLSQVAELGLYPTATFESDPPEGEPRDGLPAT